MLRYLIHDADKKVYRDGMLQDRGTPIGLGLARLAIIDRGETWEQREAQIGKLAPPVMIARQQPQIGVIINGKPLSLSARQDGDRWYVDGPGVECFVQLFGTGVFRLSLRVLVDKPISDLKIIVAGQTYKVTVEHAAERFPCDVRSIAAGTVIMLCDGKSPGTDKLEELGWMLGGTIDTKLPAGSAEQYASEVYASVQYAQQGDVKVWRSIDFILQPQGSSESFGPPLILERGKWAPLFDGSREDKTDVENTLANFYAERVYQRKGWATFGDWPHIPGNPERTRYNDHYFSVTALYRATVRSLTPERWSDMARVASTYVRDMCWQAGSKAHGKGLAPWSGPSNTNGHWVDSESLLMAWLVDGDEFARREYTKWLAAFTMPSDPGRECRVAKRMCDVAAAYTGEQVWRDRATKIQDAELDREFNNEAVTGRLWHPEWCDKTILKEQRMPEGIINGRAFPIINAWRPQYRDKNFAIVPPNCGPTGEGHLLLQMHAMRTGERIYGSTPGDPRVATRPSTTITFDKRDDRPLLLRFRLGHRIDGDLHPTSVRVYDPTGRLAFENATIPLVFNGEDAAGYPVAEYRCGLDNGPRGRWRVDVTSYALMLYAPISEWREQQEGSGWLFPAYQ